MIITYQSKKIKRNVDVYKGPLLLKNVPTASVASALIFFACFGIFMCTLKQKNPQLLS